MTDRTLLVDAHAHLDLLSGAEEEVSRAVSLGVLAVIGVSMGGESIGRTMRLREKFPGIVLPALGLHPWRTSCWRPIARSPTRARRRPPPWWCAFVNKWPP